MMWWSLLYTLYCHDNISIEGFPERFFLVYSPYLAFRDFSCTFCPTAVVSVTVCLVVLGGSFLFRNVLYFFFLLSDASSCQLVVLVVLFVCLQWHTVGAKIKVPYVEKPELWNCLPLKPGVGQSIAMHASPTARKVSIDLSDICLPSPFTMFSRIVSPYFFKKKWKLSGQWQIMKSRLQTWSKHCRLIACASAFYSLLVWLWVKMCHKWVTFFPGLFFKLFFANSFFSQFKEPALKVHQTSFI